VLNEMSGKFSRHALEHCESLGRRLSFARVKLAPLRRPPYRSFDAAAGRSRRIVQSVAPIQKVDPKLDPQRSPMSLPDEPE
jgi:hypothetical protein